MNKTLPEVPAKFARKHPKIWASFEALANQCHEGGPLDAKTRRLVKLGITLGAGLEGGFHAQVRNGLADGITPDEIRHAVLLGLTTIGFPACMAGLTWIDDVVEKGGRTTKKTRR
jgi:alkylhydroperoxidase/carboxymuconolactone decarboxylase family protein YurZ